MEAARLSQISTQQRSLTLPDLQLSYLEWNRGQEPLLLLHGMADHSLVWVELGDFLQERYHILAPDLRGHGNSGKPATGYCSKDIISDLEALMQHQGWDSAHVVAHSWSAKVAALWATQNPKAIRSLVLIDPFFINSMPRWLKPTFPVLYRTLPFLKMMGPFASYEQAAQQAQQLKQYRGWSALQQAVFAAGIEQKPNGQWGSKFVVQARDEIFDDVMVVAGLTEPVSIPTLFIQPEQGLNRTEWQLKPYKTYLKNLEIAQVPGNHWCFLVEPIAFNQAVAEFLAAQ
ncbi:alpha/beta fold hydrolase [Leptolyngbya ohadii]|uniref:alpha/beta fold hydrolase n=1 Tax=Leptolyngbya ohadii TaxID=1962290 RepID=UPI000B59A550|nr:alpha/beta hydrolase [Leptolyngbya ohadii]